MRSIAVIPARGGSKRIPRKNIRLLEGKPVICHTINLLKKSLEIDCIYVSTDDAEIESISSQMGVEIVKRPPELSNDVATTLEVMSHAVNSITARRSANFGNVFCVYPINPFLKHEYLNRALELIKTSQVEYIFTAKAFPSPIQRALVLDKLGFAEMVSDENAKSRTQDLEPTYHDAGMFYLAEPATWAKKKPIFNGNSTFIEIGKYESIDVDDEQDWAMMEQLVTLRNQGKN